MIVAAVGGDLELALGPGPDVVLAHQSGHPLAANPVAFSLQAGVHARAAVGLPALAVNCLDLLDQSTILGRPWALRSPQPVVEATRRGLQNPAHQAHRKVFSMVSDELERHFCVSEKMAIAFFKTSRSMRKRSFSRFSLRISSCSTMIDAATVADGFTPAARAWRASSLRCQRRSSDSWMPRSLATWRAE